MVTNQNHSFFSFQLYDSLEVLHENINRCILPAEYGGDMPMSKMIELWKMELAAKRERLLSLENMTLLSDRGIIRRSVKSPPDVIEMQGSFRKLQID